MSRLIWVESIVGPVELAQLPHKMEQRSSTFVRARPLRLQVGKRKKEGKKLPFLEHLKNFLGLKTLLLPPRNDKSVVDPEMKREFVSFLEKEKNILPHKNALTYHYQMVRGGCSRSEGAAGLA
jgi:hypothetical protein